MSFSRPIQWYHAHADPIWLDGTFQATQNLQTGMLRPYKKQIFATLSISPSHTLPPPLLFRANTVISFHTQDS
jgi:hypothetical protein